MTIKLLQKWNIHFTYHNILLKENAKVALQLSKYKADFTSTFNGIFRIPTIAFRTEIQLTSQSRNKNKMAALRLWENSLGNEVFFSLPPAV